MTDWVMKRARGDGVEIQLATKEGPGKQVLCVHGLTANCRCWDIVAACLTPAHAVLAMDLRGRGLSDKPASGYSLQQHVRDIFFLLDDLGLEKVVLMGHSLGAYISMTFAAQHPARVDKVILVDGGGQLEQTQWDKSPLSKPTLKTLNRRPSCSPGRRKLKTISGMNPRRLKAVCVPGSTRSTFSKKFKMSTRRHPPNIIPN